MPRKNTKAREIKKIAKSFLKSHISIGDCEECPLKESCDFVNHMDTSCGLVDSAVDDFRRVAQKSPHITLTDTLSLDIAGRCYAVIIILESYLKEYGVISVSNDTAKVSNITKEYLAALKMLNETLTTLGLNPKGRIALSNSMKVPSNGSSGCTLAAYVEGKEKDADAKSKGKGRHNRVLQRSEPAESTPTGYPSSYSEEDI
jgi:hypothetical protein